MRMFLSDCFPFRYNEVFRMEEGQQSCRLEKSGWARHALNRHEPDVHDDEGN
jgi:hypothetical protein